MIDPSRSAAAQIVAQQAAIAQIGQSALAQDSIDKLMVEACVLVGRVLEVELVDVLELAPDRTTLRVIAGTGWRPGLVGNLTLEIEAGSQSGLTLRTGAPVIVPDYSQEDRFAVSPILLEHGAVSGVSVRIGDADSPYGVLAAFSSRHDRFTREDANFVQAVANVLAAAVKHNRVETELRASRDQLAAIVDTIDEGITVQGREGLLFANDAAARMTGYASAEELLDAASVVLDRYELFAEDGRPMPIDGLPGRRAMAGEDKPEAVVGFRIRATGEIRWSVVRGTALRDGEGNVTHVINTFREITDDLWARDARSFMADAVAVLSSTLDVAEAARRLATMCVPRLADYCTVHMLEPDGSIANVALAHADPERVSVAEEAQRQRAIQPSDASGVARVIRTGQSELVEIKPEMIDVLERSERQKDLLRQLRMRWFLCVPLMGRHGPIGALSLVMAESGRILGQRELGLAEELGARAGIALENAQLYRTADDRRAQLDAVLGALAEAVLVFDQHGRLTLANAAAERLLGSPVPVALSELMVRFGVGSETAAVEPDVDDDGAPGIELQLDGYGRWLELRSYRASQRGGHAEALDPTVIVLRDVTASRGARAAREAFLGILSHELRTPITTIYGGSELLERGLDEARRGEVVSDIRAESERLARLVEDLLVMTRIERGTVEMSDEPILIQRMLPGVIRSFSSRWSEPAVTLDLGERLSAVRGDPTYVEQVVRNLLTNAVRYGKASEMGIEVVAEEHGGEVVVRVLDHGPGFSTTDSERLFDLFFRSDSAREVPGGAGIGLFVCRHLIEAMGGRMWAANRAGGGAEFGFSLPVMESDSAG